MLGCKMPAEGSRVPGSWSVEAKAHSRPEPF